MWLRNWRSSSQIIYYHISFYRWDEQASSKWGRWPWWTRRTPWHLLPLQWWSRGSCRWCACGVRVWHLVARGTLRSLRGPRVVRGWRRFCCVSLSGFRRSCLPSSGGCGSWCTSGRGWCRRACSSTSCTGRVGGWWTHEELVIVEMLKCNRILFLKLWRSLCVQNRP